MKAKRQGIGNTLDLLTSFFKTNSLLLSVKNEYIMYLLIIN